jgi:hypothetical protein
VDTSSHLRRIVAPAAQIATLLVSNNKELKLLLEWDGGLESILKEDCTLFLGGADGVQIRLFRWKRY